MATSDPYSAATSVLNTAVGLAEYLGGSTTNTLTNSSSNSSSSVISNVNTTSSDNTTTSSDTTVSNSADPAVIAMLKQLANTAIANSTDQSKTQGLLTGILQQAGDAMKVVFGNQAQAGVYNSSAATSQNNDIYSRAAADAASAILGYQTQQEQIASGIGNSLLAATATQETKNNTVSNQTFSSAASTDTQSNAQATATQSSKSSTSGSIICTWMYQTGKLSLYKYAKAGKQFNALPWYMQEGYRAVARPVLEYIKANPNSRVARGVLNLFGARTSYVCGNRSIKNFGAKALIATICTPTSIYYWLHHITATDLAGAKQHG